MMTESEAKKIAEEIAGSISGEGIACSSGCFRVCTYTAPDGNVCEGIVDVSFRPDEDQDKDELEKEDVYAVYSVLLCGDEPVCEPETDYIRAGTGSLVKFLLGLVNTAFSDKECRRLYESFRQ